MFKISHRKHLFRVTCISAIVAAVLCVTGIVISKLNNTESYATTEDGATVELTHGGTIDYDDWQTHKFNIKSDGKTYQAYCANPAKDMPDERSYSAIKIQQDSLKYNEMKLIMYIHQYAGTNSYVTAAKNRIFSSWPDVDSTKDRFAWTHAILGAIYANDYSGVDNANETRINNAIQILAEYINSDSNVWTLAKNYQLYRIEGGTGYQDIVWIEDATKYSNLNIKKCDQETRQCVPQGSASLAGIRFEVINASGEKIFNPSTGNFYDDGEVVRTGVTDTNGNLSFTNLLADGTKYRVRETATNTTYQLTAAEQTITLNQSQNPTLSFYDLVRRGNFVVDKVDKETHSCTSTGELSFAGTKFQIVNKSAQAIYYGGRTYGVGEVIAEKSVSAGGCGVEFNSLPYGKYELTETVAAAGYVKDSTPRTINIPSNNQDTVHYTFENQPIRGDLKFVKKDKTNNMVMANTIFSISRIDENKDVKETHIVVTNQEGEVNTSNSFAAHTNNTNGYDSIYNDTDENITFKGFGTWFGKDANGNPVPANNSVGALPYGTYIIQELKCDHNFHCTNIITEKVTVNITENNKVVDLGDWDNACAQLQLNTTASDKKDGDKVVEIDQEATIVDKIDYCAKKNTEYTIKGYLMDKSTGEKLLINGKPVENSITIKTTDECGTAELEFKFDASELGGKELVVFEELYYKNEKIYEHKEINDLNQTVDILKLHTYAFDYDTGSKTVPMADNVKIKDVVTYCLKPGVEYTIKGVVMDKNTKGKLLVNGEPIESTLTFTPEETCGEVYMYYDINTNDLGGAKLVIFESLYRGDDLLVEHKDFENADESFEVEIPVPDTGFFTAAFSGQKEDYKVLFIASVVIISASGYLVYRRITKKSFFKR